MAELADKINTPMPSKAMNAFRRAAVRVVDDRPAPSSPALAAFFPRLNSSAEIPMTTFKSDTPPPKKGKSKGPVQFQADIEILSSLPLQMLLYFNVYYMVVYFVVTLLIAEEKSRLTGGFPIGILICVAWLILEIIRILFGYIGNLREKVPQLAAFFVLTIIPQCGCIAYLLALQSPSWAIDNIMAAIMIIFYILELIFAVRAIRRVVNYQTTRFLFDHWSEVRTEEEEEENLMGRSRQI